MLSSFFLGYLLFQVPSGWLANRIGGKFAPGFVVVGVHDADTARGRIIPPNIARNRNVSTTIRHRLDRV